jgi:hypothetical protein
MDKVHKHNLFKGTAVLCLNKHYAMKTYGGMDV